MKFLHGKGDAGRSGFDGASNFRYNGIPEFTAFGALSLRVSKGSLVLTTACSVRSNFVLYLSDGINLSFLPRIFR